VISHVAIHRGVDEPNGVSDDAKLPAIV
jgi:hypothetical protein